MIRLHANEKDDVRCHLSFFRNAERLAQCEGSMSYRYKAGAGHFRSTHAADAPIATALVSLMPINRTEATSLTVLELFGECLNHRVYAGFASHPPTRFILGGVTLIQNIRFCQCLRRECYAANRHKKNSRSIFSQIVATPGPPTVDFVNADLSHLHPQKLKATVCTFVQPGEVMP